jgi:hypothetical protein
MDVKALNVLSNSLEYFLVVGIDLQLLLRPKIQEPQRPHEMSPPYSVLIIILKHSFYPISADQSGSKKWILSVIMVIKIGVF